jgi:serine protease AprX
MKQLKLISPHYQHADGTSFAAPIVASAVACMREANPGLSPGIMRDLLRRAASPVPGVSRERQGAGVLEAGRAVALALNEGHSRLPLSPDVDGEGVSFLLHDHDARTVRVLGSWNGWDGPGLPAGVEDGVWRTARVPLAAGRYAYKFLVDNARWLDDPANPLKWTDGFGGLNSVVQV